MNNTFFFSPILNTVYFPFTETLKLFCMNDLFEVKDKLEWELFCTINLALQNVGCCVLLPFSEYENKLKNYLKGKDKDFLWCWRDEIETYKWLREYSRDEKM